MLLCATASPHPIVEREELELVMAARGGRPLLVLDIAVPRDVEAACGELPGVTLVDIDGLQRVVAAQPARARGRGGARRDDRRGGDRALRLVDGLARRACRRSAALRAHGDAIVDGVLAENGGRWESASPRDIARAEAIARAVMARLLHEPTLQLKEHGSHARLELARELFGLADAPAEARSRRPSPRRSARCAGARGEDRHPRQRARARAGGVGGRAARRARRGGPDRDLRRPPPRRRRQARVGARARGGAAARRRRPGRPQRQGRPGRARSGSRAARRAGPRDPVRRPLRRAVAGRRARASARARCAAPPSCARGAPTSRSSSCAATSTRACASSRPARPTP